MFNHIGIGITADLVDTNDTMSGSNGYNTNVFKSPHGVIGGHIPNPMATTTVLDPSLDMGGLSLMPRERDDATTSKASRDSPNYTRSPFEPSSIWSKADSNHGWDRANANHFASRPQSPTKQPNLLVPDLGAGAGVGMGAAPKTAPLPLYAAFNPVITPPQPSAVPLPLPQRKSSPSPPRSGGDGGRDTVNKAGYHLQQMQFLLAPLVNRLEDLERLSLEAAEWKANCDATTAEVTRLQSLVNAQDSSASTVRSASLHPLMICAEISRHTLISQPSWR